MVNGLLLGEERNEKGMKAIREKMNEERIKSAKLRGQAFDENIKSSKINEIRKEQQKHYDKFLFFKNLSKAMNKTVKER